VQRELDGVEGDDPFRLFTGMDRHQFHPAIDELVYLDRVSQRLGDPRILDALSRVLWQFQQPVELRCAWRQDFANPIGRDRPCYDVRKLRKTLHPPAGDVRDEGVANCNAFESGVELGQRLGLSQATAVRMMRQQFAENAIQARSAPEYLVPADCKRP
jgi:hypothetical protein